MAEQIWGALSQALSSGSRSTVLKPLGWLVALTMAGSIGAFASVAPFWFSLILALFLFASIALYIASYCYFAVRDPDSLRSEHFSIQKLAIQKGFIGDDRAGLLKIDDNSTSVPTLSNISDGSETEK
jgi:membrane protein implicated in regulation of membrane protease activity